MDGADVVVASGLVAEEIALLAAGWDEMSSDPTVQRMEDAPDDPAEGLETADIPYRLPYTYHIAV